MDHWETLERDVGIHAEEDKGPVRSVEAVFAVKSIGGTIVGVVTDTRDAMDTIAAFEKEDGKILSW